MKSIQATRNKEYCERWQACKAANIFHSVEGIVRHLQWRVSVQIKHFALACSVPISLKSFSTLSFQLRRFPRRIFLSDFHINILYSFVTSQCILHVSPISSPLTNDALDLLAPHVRIREVPGSKLGLETEYHD
jgi:hypothetical protein